MYPVLFQLGPIVVSSWHVSYVVAALVALWVLLALARRFEPSVGERFYSSLFVVCYVSGYFGARLYSIVVEDFSVVGLWETVVALFQFGAMTFYGGAIAAFVAGMLWCLFQKVSIPRSIDIGFPAGMFALAIGRIGCFLNGDDYGRPVAFDPLVGPPWYAVSFPNLGDSVPRYPVQLLSSLGALLLGFAMIWALKHIRSKCRPGTIGYFGIVFYALGRFGLEFLRGDPRGKLFTESFSPAQVTSVLIVAALLLLSVVLPLWRSTGSEK